MRTVSGMILLLAMQLAAPAWSQTASRDRSSADELRARAVERCRANRGTDCDSPAGLQEWLIQEQPMTEAQRRSAAAARLHREQCKANPKKAGC